MPHREVVEGFLSVLPVREVLGNRDRGEGVGLNQDGALGFI
jgi:hypothetical protein